MVNEKMKEIIKEKKRSSKFEGKDFANDPFFIKKIEKAKQTISKFGLPKHLGES